MNNKLIATLTSILLASSVASTANAFELSKKGVQVGLNMGSMSGADADISGADKGYSFGVAVGGLAKFDLADKLSLRTEAQFVQKGVSYTADPVTTSTNLSYIDIPLLAEYSVLQGNIPVHVFGGVNIGILLTAEGEISGSGTSDGTTDIKSSTSALDYGLQFGVGTVVNKNIMIDARYNFGLATVDDSGTADMKNSGFLISGGYLF